MSTSTCPNGHPSESSDYCDTCGAPIGESQTPDAGSASVGRPAPTTSGAGSPAAGPGTAGEEGSTAPNSEPCPNCSLVNAPDALFCEGCGYDFTTGTMPRESTSTNPLDLAETPAPGQPGAPAQAGPPAPAQTSAQAQAGAPAQPATPATASAASDKAGGVEWVAEVWVDPDWYAEQSSDEQCPSPGLPVVVPLPTRSLLVGRRSRSRSIHPEIECGADIGVSRRQAQLTSDGQRWWVEDLQSANGTYVGAASAALPTDPLPPGQRRELGTDDRIYVGAWTCIVVRRATPEEQAGQA
jgi:hypothetical protein